MCVFKVKECLSVWVTCADVVRGLNEMKRVTNRFLLIFICEYLNGNLNADVKICSIYFSINDTIILKTLHKLST